jgi:glyceraldehyde 3-phosphate dehydrogenase
VVNGVALRVPIPVGSISDLTFVTERPVTVEEINAIFEEELRRRIHNVLSTTTEPLVSSDIVKTLTLQQLI